MIIKNNKLWLVVVVVLLVLIIFAIGIPLTKQHEEVAQVTIEPVSFTFGTVGDHSTTANAEATFQSAGSSNLDFFLSLGDLSYKNPSTYPESNWCQMVKNNLNIGAGLPIGDAYGEQYPFEIISGNHESDQTHNNGLIDNFVAANCMPNRLTVTQSPHLGINPHPSTGNYAKEYYFDYPQTGTPIARFIMLAPGLHFEYGGTYTFAVGSPRYQWLSDTIDQARASGIKWVIVANHYNYISTGQKTDQTGPGYFNLLINKNVDLVLQGHDHTYQRSKQFSHTASCPELLPAPINMSCIVDDGSDASYVKGLGPVLLIAGNGGHSFYTMAETDAQIPYFSKRMLNSESTSGFTKVTIDMEALNAVFVPATTGGFTDEFAIVDPSADAADNP
ncbi:MAG: metallophosphoesterase [Candidatus Saccharimonadales bacterium]